MTDFSAREAAIAAGEPYYGALGEQQGTRRHKYFSALVRACGAAHPFILEVGSWAGCSLAAWDKAAGRFSGAVVVDTWQPYAKDEGAVYDYMRDAAASGKIFDLFMHNLVATGMTARVHIIRGDSRTVLPELNLMFDIAFIDGDHRYEFVKADIENCMELVRPGGILCGDDLEMVLPMGTTAEGLQTHREAVERGDDILGFYLPHDGVWDYYHPGVTQAVWDVFHRKISCFEGLWAVRKTADGWEDVIL